MCSSIANTSDRGEMKISRKMGGTAYCPMAAMVSETAAKVANVIYQLLRATAGTPENAIIVRHLEGVLAYETDG